MANDEVFQSITVKQFNGPLSSSTANGPALIDTAASNTAPTLIPDRSDIDTGIGQAAGDALSLVAGGVEAIRLVELSSGVIIAYKSSTFGITANTGSAQGNTPLTTSFNVISTCANAGDAVTLPTTFQAGSVVYVKNDGAESADVFPASGDDAGAGANTAVAVASGDFACFISTASNSTWTKLCGGTA